MPNQSPEKPVERSLSQSNAYAERARAVIPGGAQTHSKSPSQFVQGVAPTHIERGDGSHVWDVDGNEYIDYVMALGPVVLGHNYPEVTRAVEAQLSDGSMYSLPHPLQVEVAELVVDAVPCAEMVRFGKNGNDVTTLAAKLARAYTGRDVIATQGYHGWTDVWMANSSGDRGIPDAVGGYTEHFKYNDIESLERIFEEHPDDVAAIVTTPVNFESPADDFVQRMREIADREGALLVFDEILTGFRCSLGGAQEYFGVTPDLACFAKAMANGFPLSALAGRRDVMEVISDDDFVYSMTYAGEAPSLAAAKAALEVQREEDVHGHIARQGEKLRDGYNDLAAGFDLDDRTHCRGYPWRTQITFSDEEGVPSSLAKSLFMQECLKREVLFTGDHLVSYSHSDEDIERTLEVYRAALSVLSLAYEQADFEDRIEGTPVGATMRERTDTEEN